MRGTGSPSRLGHGSVDADYARSVDAEQPPSQPEPHPTPQLGQTAGPYQPGPSPLPSMQHRVSDRERDAVGERLREAAAEGRLRLDELDERLDAAYRARTYADLLPLTNDLPDRSAGLGQQAHPSSGKPSVPARVGGTPTRYQSWALMSGVNRRGSWVVPPEYIAVAVMGGIQLDLTTATLSSREVVIRVVAVMGGVEVIVPPDIAVMVDGLGLMGGFDEAPSTQAPAPGAPLVRVTGVAIMGGVSVRRPKPLPQR